MKSTAYNAFARIARLIVVQGIVATNEFHRTVLRTKILALAVTNNFLACFAERYSVSLSYVSKKRIQQLRSLIREGPEVETRF